MKTNEFIAQVLGCTIAESNFIDKLTDEFPFVDLTDNDVLSFPIINVKRGLRICNHIIIGVYEQIINHYAELGLRKDYFDYDINSVCSHLYYNGEVVSYDDLEIISETN